MTEPTGPSKWLHIARSLRAQGVEAHLVGVRLPAGYEVRETRYPTPYRAANDEGGPAPRAA